jgi:hypothetical protein
LTIVNATTVRQVHAASIGFAREAAMRGIRQPLGAALAAAIALTIGGTSVHPAVAAGPPPDALLVVDQHREAIVEQTIARWPGSISQDQATALRRTLWSLRADHLLAASLTPGLTGLLSVIDRTDQSESAASGRAAPKALGDPLADLAYAPLTPCRIADTRTGGGALAPNVTRTFVGFTATTFVGQGGDVTNCGIPDRVAALAMNVYAVNPTTLGFIRLWPANQAEPTVSTVNYQPPLVAIATGAIVPVDASASNAFNAKSPGSVDLIVDVVGYFRAPIAPGAGLRIVRDAMVDTVNTVNGSSANAVSAGVRGATIAGGGAPPEESDPDFPFEAPNEVRDHYGTVGGGLSNRAGDSSASPADRAFATVGGGFNNIASGYSSTVGGGGANMATGNWSAVGGGSVNRAYGHRSTVAGGADNVAAGDYSWAGGRRAKTHSAGASPVDHAGAFAWADSEDFDFHTLAANEFAVRSTGGVRFVTAIDVAGAPAWTCGVSAGPGSSWGCSSDRDRKAGLTPIDAAATLERLVAMPIYRWYAKDDPRRIAHAGPTAQDFMAAFGLGDDDRMIGFADAQGIALAAIQGLNASLEARLLDRDAEVSTLRRELTALRREVEALRRATAATSAGAPYRRIGR